MFGRRVITLSEQPPNPGRRRLIKTSAAALVGAGLAYAERKYLGEKYENFFDPEKVKADIEKRCKFLQEAYGLKLEFTESQFITEKKTGEELSFDEQRDVLNWLMAEIAKYPPEYIKRLGLSRLAFIKNYVDEDVNADIGGRTIPAHTIETKFGEESHEKTLVIMNIRFSTISYHHPLAVLGGKPEYSEFFHHELGHAGDIRFETSEGLPKEYGHKNDYERVHLNPNGNDAYIGDKANKLSSTLNYETNSSH